MRLTSLLNLWNPKSWFNTDNTEVYPSHFNIVYYEVGLTDSLKSLYCHYLQ
jgi:hypothetical protein